MDFTSWGQILSMTNHFARVKRYNSNFIYHIIIYDKEVKVTLKNKNNTILEFIDRPIENGNLNSFQRIIRNHEYIFIDNKCVLKKIKRETKFLTPLIGYASLSNKFITLYIETRTIDNIFIPYCISYFDGNKATSFYLSDYKNSDDMLISCIISLLKRKYNGYKIYVHNLSNFDGIFLLRILSNIPNFILDPIIRDGKLINLSLKKQVGQRTYKIDFRDSLLMLPISLDKLSKAFQVENNKTIFPYLFVNNKEIPLTYNGLVPSIDYFDKLSNKDYLNYSNSFKIWNLKNETIKYCENDCIVLYQVLIKFNELIFNKYNLNIHKFTTLPSLTLAIYKTFYLSKNIIPKLGADIYDFIRSGYTGGHTDMYKPSPKDNKLVYCYDVNSLYPNVMQAFNMPVGTPQYFDFGKFVTVEELNKYIKNPFGFFEVEITTPKSIDKPIFQTKVKTKNGLRTISPIGTWTDIIFSEEMFNCIKYGYKFKIQKGYLFERHNIFKEYINDLYKIKESLNKDEPMYLVSKLLNELSIWKIWYVW